MNLFILRAILPFFNSTPAGRLPLSTARDYRGKIEGELDFESSFDSAVSSSARGSTEGELLALYGE